MLHHATVLYATVAYVELRDASYLCRKGAAYMYPSIIEAGKQVRDITYQRHILTALLLLCLHVRFVP